MRHRIAFYCHQLRGLGHLALSLHLCESLSRERDFSIALITRSLAPVQVPDCVKLVWLPPLIEPLHHPGALKMLQERAAFITAFCRQWRPACVIVDQMPLGIGAELLPVLETAQEENWETVFALGLSYTEGLPNSPGRNPKTLRAFLKYSFVIGYVDQQFEPILDNLPRFLRQACRHYVGVATPAPARHVARTDGATPKRLMVFCGGGFYNTPAFIRLVAQACRSLLRENKIRLTCIAGKLCGHVSLSPEEACGVTILPEGKVEDHMAHADVVVARCGYNTAFTIIRGVAPVVFVPVPGQDSEQINRAKKLAQLDRVWCVEESAPDLDSLLAKSITAAVGAPLGPRPLPFHTDGANRLAVFLKEIL